MKQYLDLLRYVTEHGTPHQDRTGVGTRCVFGYQMRHDMNTGFPLLTTKRIHWRSVIVELLWFLRGDTNVKFLRDHGCTIWDEWADENGDLGPIYGQQWRRWQAPRRTGEFMGIAEIDQIRNLIEGLKRDPESRRLCVCAWNPGDVPQMAMPPCHPFWQVRAIGGKLNLHFVMRSTDAFLGLPFNFASYAAILCILAKLTDLAPGELVASFGDLHIYNNHSEQVQMQLVREPNLLPWLHIDPVIRDLGMHEWQPRHFEILSYEPHPAIKAPVAV